MKWIMFLLAMSMCLFVSFERGWTIDTVNGLFYLDGSPVSIHIKDGFITQISRLDEAEKDQLKTIVAPGFIDIQINGYAGVDFSGPDLSVDDVRRATKALWKEGVTSYFPTVITQPHERLLRNFNVLAEASKQDDIGRSIPGFHLEGPYISPKDGFRGAHLEKFVRPPDWKELSEYVRAAEGKIKLFTIAPEVDGAFDMIRHAVSNGMVVAIGHTGADAEQIMRAADAGATISTHLGNGCANMIHRHHNPLWPQLADDRLSPTLIVDGHHLTREEVRTFFKVKGAQNVMLISDALDLAGMPPGEYMAGGKKVVMTPDGMIKYPEENVLAGASLTIHRGVHNVMLFTDCSLADAVHMASRNQAVHFDLEDRGELLPGKRADMVLFTRNNNSIVVEKTIIAGEVVYENQTDN